MSTFVIERSPELAGALRLLEALELPTADLTEAHMADFLYSGDPVAPDGLVGVEFCGCDSAR